METKTPIGVRDVFNNGSEILLMCPLISSLSGFEGVVEECEANSLEVFVRVNNFPMVPGSLIMLQKVGDAANIAWATLERSERGNGGFKLYCGNTRVETPENQRAARTPVDFLVHVTYLEKFDGSNQSKQTIGTAVNMSTSGLRVRLRSPISVGSAVHLQLYISNEEAVVALARVVRVASGNQMQGVGYDVGLQFLRVLKNEHLIESVVRLELEELGEEQNNPGKAEETNTEVRQEESETKSTIEEERAA
jgi:hypothetical protein